jgi:hypothetical protein
MQAIGAIQRPTQIIEIELNIQGQWQHDQCSNPDGSQKGTAIGRRQDQESWK